MSQPADAPRPVWARVVKDSSGEYGWLNVQTNEFVADEAMARLSAAYRLDDGAVVGDPDESEQWLSATRGVREVPR